MNGPLLKEMEDMAAQVMKNVELVNVLFCLGLHWQVLQPDHPQKARTGTVRMKNHLL